MRTVQNMSDRPFKKILCYLSLLAVCVLTLPSIAFADGAKSSKQRFDFCKDPNAGCKPGKGYQVCEDYLKDLNAMPPDRKQNACVVWRDPIRKDFTLPDWESLDVLEHLDWIYEMEKKTLRWAANPPPPSFETWHIHFEERIRRGEIKPTLKRTSLELLQGKGPVTVLAFNEGDPDHSGCNGEQPIEAGANMGGDYFYWFNERYTQPIIEINGLDLPHFLIIYKGHPFFLSQDASLAEWNIWIDALYPFFSTSNDIATYAVGKRCEYRDIELRRKGASK